MKNLSFFFLIIITVLSCREKEYHVDATINIDKTSYSLTDTILVDFEAEANQNISFIEAKILDNNSITASSVSNLSVDAKKISGQLRLTFLEQFYESGTYTVQVTFGSGDNTHREFEEFLMNNGTSDLSGFLVSETTLGDCNIHLINEDGSELIASESSAIDLLGTNFVFDQLTYSNTNGRQLNLHSIPDGELFEYNTSTYNPVLDATSDNNSHYIINDDSQILTCPISGSSLNSRSYSKNFTHIEENGDYLFVSSEGFNGSSYRVTSILKSTLSEHQDFILSQSVLDIKNLENRIFVLTSSSLYEINAESMTMSQIYSGTGLESIAGIYDNSIYLNHSGGYRYIDLDTFIGQDFSSSAEEVLIVPNNEWLVKNYGSYLEICNVTNGDVINNINFSGTAVELQLMN